MASLGDVDIGSYQNTFRPSQLYGTSDKQPTSDEDRLLVDPASNGVDEYYLAGDGSPKTTRASAWFNISNVIVGAGTLSIPYAMLKTGIVLGITLVVIMGVLASFSLRLLLYTADWTGAESFQQVANRTYGRKCVRLVDVVVIGLCFSVILAYFIIIGDLLSPVFIQWMGDDSSIITNKDFIRGMVVAGIIFPLSIFRRLDFLKHTSLIALLCMLYLLILVITWAVYSDFNDIIDGNIDNVDISKGKEVVYASFTQDIFFALPIIAFAFSSHIQVYQIYREMGVNDVPMMMGVVRLSVLTCAILYLSVGTFGYLTFYQTTSGNIFNNFTSESNVFVALGKCGLAITLIFSSPLFVFPLRDTLTSFFISSEDPKIQQFCITFCPCLQPEKKFSWLRHILIAIAWLGLAFLLAVVSPDVADVLALTGATCSTSVMYLFPAVFYLSLERECAQQDDPLGTAKRWGARALLVWGIVMAIAGTVVSAIQFADK